MDMWSALSPKLAGLLVEMRKEGGDRNHCRTRGSPRRWPHYLRTMGTARARLICRWVRSAGLCRRRLTDERATRRASQLRKIDSLPRYLRSSKQSEYYGRDQGPTSWPFRLMIKAARDAESSVFHFAPHDRWMSTPSHAMPIYAARCQTRPQVQIVFA